MEVGQRLKVQSYGDLVAGFAEDLLEHLLVLRVSTHQFQNGVMAGERHFDGVEERLGRLGFQSWLPPVPKLALQIDSIDDRGSIARPSKAVDPLRHGLAVGKRLVLCVARGAAYRPCLAERASWKSLSPSWILSGVCGLSAGMGTGGNPKGLSAALIRNWWA
jgi:hypothetical protein